MTLDHLIEQEQRAVHRLTLQRAEVRKGGGDTRPFQAKIDERHAKIKTLRAEQLADDYISAASAESYPVFDAVGGRYDWTQESRAEYRDQHPEQDFPGTEFLAQHPEVAGMSYDRRGNLVGAL